MRKKLINVVVLICILVIVPSIVFAGDINTDEYEAIYNSKGTGEVTRMGGSIIAIIQVIGVSAGIILLIIMGMKYMFSSIEEKASIKERLIPYVIGAVIMFGGTGMLTIIANFARGEKQDLPTNTTPQSSAVKNCSYSGCTETLYVDSPYDKCSIHRNN